MLRATTRRGEVWAYTVCSASLSYESRRGYIYIRGEFLYRITARQHSRVSCLRTPARSSALGSCARRSDLNAQRVKRKRRGRSGLGDGNAHPRPLPLRRLPSRPRSGPARARFSRTDGSHSRKTRAPGHVWARPGAGRPVRAPRSGGGPRGSPRRAASVRPLGSHLCSRLTAP